MFCFFLDSTPNNSELCLPEVNSEILSQVIDYMNHHHGHLVKDMQDIIKDPFDVAFINKISENLSQLYSLIFAAHFMGINSLANLGCAKIASRLNNGNNQMLDNQTVDHHTIKQNG
jgi:hypothetical protein